MSTTLAPTLPGQRCWSQAIATAQWHNKKQPVIKTGRSMMEVLAEHSLMSSAILPGSVAPHTKRTCDQYLETTGGPATAL